MSLELSDVAKAALDEVGPMLVLGGPGSGKTTVSLLKAQRIIPELQPGQQVLFLSFSRAAVRQVLSRCKDIISRSDRKQIVVKTYHSFCMEVLRAHGRLLTGTQPRLYYPSAERVGRAAFDGDWEVERSRLARDEGVYVFDLFAGSCAELLGRSNAVRCLLSQKYPVIIIDEFQDTDDSQWELVKQLSRSSRMIVLADPDQRIFEYDKRIDPKRLDALREFLYPAEFDLGDANHRSPDAGILQFADAVLRNAPLPTTDDVKEVKCWPKSFDATVHAAVIWMFSRLRETGVTRPTVAVLCRSNPFVADISTLLGQSHTYNGQALTPVEHDVVWDEDLSAAAAQVVASVLEWPQCTREDGSERTLRALARYFEMKNAIKPSATAKKQSAQYTEAAAVCGRGVKPRIKAAQAISTLCSTGVEFRGDPRADWLVARTVLSNVSALSEVHTNARFIRLFRATDEIGQRLSQRWALDGSYGNATEIVRQALEQGRVIADQSDHDGCVLMTMHKSKGKEFDGVVLVEGPYRGKFFDEREEPPHHATRRLLRVALTRARQRVVIVRPRGAPALANGRHA